MWYDPRKASERLGGGIVPPSDPAPQVAQVARVARVARPTIAKPAWGIMAQDRKQGAVDVV
jgi:hypothetical protein